MVLKDVLILFLLQTISICVQDHTCVENFLHVNYPEI
jgi:hypothetical protein